MAILLSQTVSVIGQKISTTALQVQLQQLPALLSPYVSRRQPTNRKDTVQLVVSRLPRASM